MNTKNDLLAYILVQLGMGIGWIWAVGLSSVSILLITIIYILYPWTLYFRYFGLGFLQTPWEESEIKSIINVLSTKKKASKIDRLYFFAYAMFIGLGLLIFTCLVFLELRLASQ